MIPLILSLAVRVDGQYVRIWRKADTEGCGANWPDPPGCTPSHQSRKIVSTEEIKGAIVECRQRMDAP